MFAFLEGLFALGTIGFWLLALVVGILVTVLVEKEEGVWATVVMIGSVIGLNWLYKLPIWDTIKVNPGKTALFVGGYFVVGATWSLVKWFFFLHKERIKYEEFKAKFLVDNKVTELTPALAAELAEKLAAQRSLLNGVYPYTHISQAPPNAREYKSDLTRWATYWPFSIVGTLLNDVVRKAWNYIYEMLQSTYQRMSNHVFRGATADLKMAQEFKEKAAVEKAAKAGAKSGGNDPSADQPNKRGW